MKYIAIIFVALILLTSCKKEGVHLASGEYMVFGHFYGECFGEQCIEIYRLEKDQLLEDTKDQYPSSDNFYTGAYVKLPSQKYNAVKDLPSFFPSDLLLESKRVIGQPDAGDWGGFYIEYNYNGVRQFWLLDKVKGNVPLKYHSFIDKLNEKIDLLK